LDGVRAYNRADGESTLELRRWLGARQTEARIGYLPPPPKDDKKERPDSARDAAEALAQRLLGAIPSDRSADPERWRVQELLAWLIGFHKREAKPIWWTVFDRQKRTDQELVEDSDCLGGLVRTATPPVRDKQSLLYEYRFDSVQDTSVFSGAFSLIHSAAPA